MYRKLLGWFLVLCLCGTFFYRSFYYVDSSQGCFIRFTPSIFLEFNTGNIKQGIQILKKAAPEEYDKLCQYVGTINANVSCGGFQGGCYQPGQSKQIYVSVSHSEYLGWTAGIIAHEVCHARQAYENREFSEPECYEVTNQVLQQVVRD